MAHLPEANTLCNPAHKQWKRSAAWKTSGVGLGDYKCLSKVVTSSLWNRRWAQELWVMNNWRAHLAWSKDIDSGNSTSWRKEGKCYNQFIAGSLQSHPLNVTLQQCPITQDFLYIQQKTADVSTAVDSDLRWTELLHEEACSNILTKPLELYELCKKARSRADILLMHSKPIGSHGQMQRLSHISCAGWLGDYT